MCLFDDIVSFVSSNFKDGRKISVDGMDIIFVGFSREMWFMGYSGKGEKRRLVFEGVVRKDKLGYLMINDIGKFEEFVRNIPGKNDS